MGLGIPPSPDRAASRSQSARWFSWVLDASETPRPEVLGVAAVAIIAVVVAAAVGAVPLAGAAAIALLVPAAVVDVDERRLPDAWLAAALGALVLALAASPAFGAPTDTGPTIGGLLGGATAMALPVLALHLASPASMGFGDVKAAAVLGAAVGTIDWRLGAVALCLAALAGAAVGISTRRRTIAFGPFLVFGAWFALLAHEPIIETVLAGGVAP